MVGKKVKEGLWNVIHAIESPFKKMYANFAYKQADEFFYKVISIDPKITLSNLDSYLGHCPKTGNYKLGVKILESTEDGKAREKDKYYDLKERLKDMFIPSYFRGLNNKDISDIVTMLDDIKDKMEKEGRQLTPEEVANISYKGNNKRVAAAVNETALRLNYVMPVQISNKRGSRNKAWLARETTVNDFQQTGEKRIFGVSFYGKDKSGETRGLFRNLQVSKGMRDLSIDATVLLTGLNAGLAAAAGKKALYGVSGLIDKIGPKNKVANAASNFTLAEACYGLGGPVGMVVGSMFGTKVVLQTAFNAATYGMERAYKKGNTKLGKGLETALSLAAAALPITALYSSTIMPHATHNGTGHETTADHTIKQGTQLHDQSAYQHNITETHEGKFETPDMPAPITHTTEPVHYTTNTHIHWKGGEFNKGLQWDTSHIKDGYIELNARHDLASIVAQNAHKATGTESKWVLGYDYNHDGKIANIDLNHDGKYDLPGEVQEIFTAKFDPNHVAKIHVDKGFTIKPLDLNHDGKIDNKLYVGLGNFSENINHNSHVIDKNVDWYASWSNDRAHMFKTGDQISTEIGTAKDLKINYHILANEAYGNALNHLDVKNKGVHIFTDNNGIIDNKQEFVNLSNYLANMVPKDAHVDHNAFNNAFVATHMQGSEGSVNLNNLYNHSLNVEHIVTNKPLTSLTHEPSLLDKAVLGSKYINEGVRGYSK